MDDFKEMDRRLYQQLIVCPKGAAKNYLCVRERSVFKAWKQTASHSTQEKVQICGVLECDTPSEHGWADMNKIEDTARREEHTAGMGQED